MNIAIVILNWNGKHWLEQFLPSVVQHSGLHTIYVADNASTDDSVSWLATHYPQVHVIAMHANRGYAGGYNEALKHIKEPLACLLNSDIEVTAGWLDAIPQRFISEPVLAALQPKIRDYNRKEYFEYAGAAGGYLDCFAYPYCRGRVFHVLEKDAGQYDDRPYLDWASGAALVVRMDAFYKVGGFDTGYFAHQEEVDLCWRMRLQGYKISIEPASLVYHVGGGTLNAISPQKTFYNFRNSLYNIVKNDKRNTWFFILVLRMVLDGVAAVRFLAFLQGNHFIAVFKAHLSFYAHLSALLKQRKAGSQVLVLEKPVVKSIVYEHFIKGKKIFTEI